MFFTQETAPETARGKRNAGVCIIRTVKFIKNSCIYLAARCAFAFALVLPREFGLRLFGAAGAIAFMFPNREKTRTLDHLRMIFGGEWTEKRIRETARGVYVSLGKNMFDAITLSRSPDSAFNAIVKHDDLSPFKKAYDLGRGVFAITAHVGCFEMLLHFFARRGFKSFAIGQRSFDPRLDALIRTLRSGPNIDYLDRTENLRKIIRWLKEGKVFGALIDQDTSVEGVYAKFLGKTAWTPSGSLRMAMRFRIPTIIVTTARQPDNTHYIYISKPLEFAETGDFEADLVANVQKANDRICETIMRFPEQWVWMHRRWKRQPPGVPDPRP